MAEGTVGYIGYAEFFGSLDQVIGLVECLKSRILSLDGVDLGNCKVSDSLSKGSL